MSKEFKNERFYREIILLVLRILILEQHGEIREDLGRGNKQGQEQEIRLMEEKDKEVKSTHSTQKQASKGSVLVTLWWPQKF